MIKASDAVPVFVLISESEGTSKRLQDYVGERGKVVVSDPSSLERIVQIVDSVAAALVIIHIPDISPLPLLRLIEDLHGTKPMLPILVFADAITQDLLLSAMRAGANDLMPYNIPREDLLDRLQMVLKKHAFATEPSQQRTKGKIIACVSARPDTDCALLSLHLALAFRQLEPDSKTLMLDLGVPEADSLLFLGLRSTYSFIDAMRSIRRFDETLIETAFAKHESGLALLAMPEEAGGYDITANDVIILLNILRSYYQYIVMNLGGLPKSHFLQLTASHANELFLLCEQTVPSCLASKNLMEFFRNNQFDHSIELLVDRYLEKQEPDAKEISSRLRTPLRGTLPPSGLARINMKNSGRTLFEFAPKDKYALAIMSLAKSCMAEAAEKKSPSRLSFFKRLLASQ